MESGGQIRDIRDEELELILSWRNAPNVRKNMYTQHEISLDEHLAWWQRVREERKNQKYLMYEKSGRPLGVVSFNDIDVQNERAMWAFYAAPEAPRGTGLAMEFLALDYAFREIGLHKLSCEVLAFNTPVIKLHKRFGFSVEGIFRAHHKIGGEFVDVYRLGMLAGEWKTARPDLEEKLAKMNKG
ncbi:UDP-4-amino-4,6-dideoxy-N-acetyl-beta-L-altrosamine N-acetyltransferase [Guyparkeria hydrothermalis]|uniref:UDP-4-amino-4, 6-dideoxy-N-acetyl-beta-L-altrosamine N-acetyltransferase n=1 Tax=Guyparkeria hydrothermalis TaxID=923 RepID=UPI0020207846|nr:UDP-4-amino-4,6-dideoxy-N-acetyl-beta-L-altrosamine N-acetyltransferase [Guyparkeria hydrothermalis]MCL7751319.1 UDP-4-amino-4,6-dideoxy-N-acetyl-beta-L-altrosamine N-acetyltransferase [Guyparkeria hydrothermalis]